MSRNSCLLFLFRLFRVPSTPHSVAAPPRWGPRPPGGFEEQGHSFNPPFPNRSASGRTTALSFALGHDSGDNEIFFNLRNPGFLRLHLKPLPNGGLDVLDGFFPGGTLGMATRQHRATDRPAFFGLNQVNSILHSVFMAQAARSRNARFRRKLRTGASLDEDTPEPLLLLRIEERSAETGDSRRTIGENCCTW